MPTPQPLSRARVDGPDRQAGCGYPGRCPFVHRRQAPAGPGRPDAARNGAFPPGSENRKPPQPLRPRRAQEKLPPAGGPAASIRKGQAVGGRPSSRERQLVDQDWSGAGTPPGGSRGDLGEGEEGDAVAAGTLARSDPDLGREGSRAEKGLSDLEDGRRTRRYDLSPTHPLPASSSCPQTGIPKWVIFPADRVLPEDAGRSCRSKAGALQTSNPLR